MSAPAANANAAPADGAAPAKPKSKKLLFIIIGVVVVALIGAGVAFFLLMQSHGDEEGDDTEVSAQDDEHASPGKRDPHTPPTFLPLDSMVVNLADPGGNRYAQLGITLQLADSKTGDDIKVYMPSIRNGILIVVSQRTAEQMLGADGKQALKQDIMAEVAHVMGYDYQRPGAEPAPKSKKGKPATPNPLEDVLFSSFIIQ